MSDAIPKTGRYTVTPIMAAKLLERNRLNRPVSRREVERLKRIIEAGQWQYNGEAVKFGEGGNLLDGQHRLIAVSEGATAVDMLIVSELGDDVFDTLDQGRKRTGGDVLYVRGEKNHNALAAASAQVFRMLRNKPIYSGGDAIPAYGVATIFERHIGLADVLDTVAPMHREAEAPVVGLGQAAAYAYILGRVMGREVLANHFSEGLLVGSGLEVGSPLLKFRQRIFDGRTKGRSMPAKAKQALLAKVTGLVLTGEEVRTLTTPNPGASEYFRLIPGLKEAVAKLDDKQALTDLPY